MPANRVQGTLLQRSVSFLIRITIKQYAVVIIIPFWDWEKNPRLQAVVVHSVGK